MTRKTVIASTLAVIGTVIAGASTHIGLTNGYPFLGGFVAGLGGALCWSAGHVEGIFDHAK